MPASSARKFSKPRTAQQGAPRFEVITPPRQPKDLITYRKAGPGVVDPVENAETQLSFLNDDFCKWLADDQNELLESWRALKQDPTNSAKFLRFHKSAHTILGNAAILKCNIGSMLAAPLAKLLERAPEIKQQIELIDAAVLTIDSALSGYLQEDDPRLGPISDGLNTIVDRWIARNTSSGR